MPRPTKAKSAPKDSSGNIGSGVDFIPPAMAELYTFRRDLRADCVPANGPASAGSSNQSGEAEIRQKLIEADLVDYMVALHGQLFYSTQIPVCLWFLAKNNHDGKRRAVSELELALAA